MGNLYSDKLAKALFLLFKNGTSFPAHFKIIAFARRDFNTKEFQSLTREFILKKDKNDIEKLEEFLSHIEYIKGDFSNKEDFFNLKNSISLEEDGLLVFHLATPLNLYETIFRNIKDTNLHKLNTKTRIMIEKPFGKDELDAKNLQTKLVEIFNSENIFHIDHYLTKETVIGISDFRWKNGELEERWNKNHIEKIKVIFHESNIVGSRGASYDVAGAFRDVGQNHMLQMLAVSIMEKPLSSNGDDFSISRLNALRNLYVDYNQKITRGQYEGYHLENNVNSNSKTETFFRVFLKSNDLNFSDVIFELEGGKGLVDMKSDITTTTVAVEVYFKDGEVLKNKEFKIQPVVGTIYDSYVKVYNDVIKGDHSNFPSIEEIILEWRLTDELLSKWLDFPIVIYKKGSKAEDIK